MSEGKSKTDIIYGAMQAHPELSAKGIQALLGEGYGMPLIRKVRQKAITEGVVKKLSNAGRPRKEAEKPVAVATLKPAKSPAAVKVTTVVAKKPVPEAGHGSALKLYTELQRLVKEYGKTNLESWLAVIG